MTPKPLPLAAVLLLAAAVSQAQLLTPPAGGSGTGSSLLNLGGAFDMAQKGDDLTAQAPLSGGDFYKKCGTVPFRACTPEEEKARQKWLKDAANDKNNAPAPIAGPPQMMESPYGGGEGKILKYPDGRVEYCFDNSCTKTNGTPMTPDQANSYYWHDFNDAKQMANSINGGGANRPATPQLPPGVTCTQLKCDMPPINASNGGGASAPSGDDIVVTGNRKTPASDFSAFSAANNGGGDTGGGSSAADDATTVNNAQNTVTGNNGGGSLGSKSSGGSSSVASSNSGSGSGSGNGFGTSSSGGSGNGASSTGGSDTGGKGAKMLPTPAAKLDNIYSYTVIGANAEKAAAEAERIKSGQTELATQDGTNIHTINRAELQITDPKTLGKIKATAQ